MSPFSIASTLSSLFSLAKGSSSTATTSSATGSAAAGTDFSSSLALRMASLQAQSVSALLSTTSSSGSSGSSGLDFLTNTSGASSGSNDVISLLNASSNVQGLSATGRKISLTDPESAYTMMTAINNKDVTYKAQYSELSAMETAVAGMQKAAETLSGVDATTDNATIKSKLQDFAAQYNDWSKRFEGTVQSGGVLAGTQAAEVSLNELENSVGNIFNGAADGFHGLGDLGFSVDPTTNLASLDGTKLDAALAANKQGVVNTIDQFSANFAKSAELLDSPNNFIPNRLTNLDHVIDYIAANKTSLQSEFGLGDAATPSAQVAKALASYNQIFGS